MVFISSYMLIIIKFAVSDKIILLTLKSSMPITKCSPILHQQVKLNLFRMDLFISQTSPIHLRKSGWLISLCFLSSSSLYRQTLHFFLFLFLICQEIHKLTVERWQGAEKAPARYRSCHRLLCHPWLLLHAPPRRLSQPLLGLQRTGQIWGTWLRGGPKATASAA